MSKNNHNFFRRCLSGVGSLGKKAFLRIFLSKEAIKSIEKQIHIRGDFQESLKESYKLSTDFSSLAKEVSKNTSTYNTLVKKPAKAIAPVKKTESVLKRPEVEKKTSSREELLNNLQSIYRDKQEIFNEISDEDREKIKNIAKSIFK